MTVFECYTERNELLKLYFSEKMFSELKGVSWLNECAELFPTVRIHIAKMDLFSPIADSYVVRHWKDEIRGCVRIMVACKKPGWIPDARLFMSNVDEWLNDFNDTRVLAKINSADYKEYRERLMSYYSLNESNYERQFLKLLEKSHSKCDDVFRAVMVMMVEALQDKSVNTKSASAIQIMGTIKDNMEAKLNELITLEDD